VRSFGGFMVKINLRSNFTIDEVATMARILRLLTLIDAS
jgi:hypothetical protein